MQKRIQTPRIIGAREGLNALEERPKAAEEPSLGETLIALNSQLLSQVRDLAAGLAILSEELGVPIGKDIVSSLEPVKEKVSPPLGLLPLAIDKTRDASTFAASCLHILNKMKVDIGSPFPVKRVD